MLIWWFLASPAPTIGLQHLPATGAQTGIVSSRQQGAELLCLLPFVQERRSNSIGPAEVFGILRFWAVNATHVASGPHQAVA